MPPPAVFCAYDTVVGLNYYRCRVCRQLFVFMDESTTVDYRDHSRSYMLALIDRSCVTLYTLGS